MSKMSKRAAHTSATISCAELDPEKIRVKYLTKMRRGKSQRDNAGGYPQRAYANKQRPIRCTSSHRLGGQDNRGPEFWRG
jgi:hypothetical protein